jgi:hypothetical protein
VRHQQFPGKTRAEGRHILEHDGGGHPAQPRRTLRGAAHRSGLALKQVRDKTWNGGRDLWCEYNLPVEHSGIHLPS